MKKKLTELNDFTVWSEHETNRISIQIQDLGWVCVNRTHEGLILDVTDGEEIVGTLALEESDFAGTNSVD